MSFEKRRIPQDSSTTTKKSYKTRSSTKKVKNKKWFFAKFLLWFIMSSFVVVCIWAIIIHQKYIKHLPSISELEKIEIAEASIIYDKNGNELYKVFEEKRTYQDYENINQNMVHAIVAWEDKRFFENPWVDIIGLTRAVLYRAGWKTDKIEGTSTLTQQLIRNMVITNERTIERKIKEMYLAYKLTNNLSKEKILELYLNKISFWSNAFGIEQASQTFFSKSSDKLSILESAMLASLPKGPSFFSPYSNFDRLVGYPYTYTPEDPDNHSFLTVASDIETHKWLVTKLTDFISDLKIQRIPDSSSAVLCGLKREYLKSNISIDSDGCSAIAYSELLTFLNGIKIEWENENIEYQTGRKDFILGRMLEDEYIDFEEYKLAVIGGIGFEFQTYTEDIKYPHFVFYVREFLEEKYGKEILERGGLRVYTSLDPVLQDKAQEIVEKYGAANYAKYDTQNAALVSIDNKTGQILAMVGGRDYFDEENKGNVNITTSRLQPGSTFKPFVYSIAIDKEIIGSRTPIYDLKTKFPWDYEPDNFDGKFKGKMDITTALNESRNIPAVKMYFLAGGENSIGEWMTKLWVKSIQAFKEEYLENRGTTYSYGAAMWLGTAMMTPLELAGAYSVYANLGEKKEIVPVTKILDSRGLVIEEFTEESSTWEIVIDPSTAYIMNHMLSDTSARPQTWNKYLSLNGRPVAAKTGTSTKQYEKNGEKIIYPRNLWTVWYTPQVTTVTWAWNNDWKQANFDGSGLQWAGPMWKDFMEFYHSDEWVEQWEQPQWVKNVSISNISGNLAWKGIGNLAISSLFINPPTEYGNGLRSARVDKLCNGAVTEKTPEAAIGYINIADIRSLRPDDPAWENPVQNWAAWGWYAWSGLYTRAPRKICQRSEIKSDIQLAAQIGGKVFVPGANYVNVGYRSASPIKNITVFLNEKQIQSVDLPGQIEWVFSGNINIPQGTVWSQSLRIRAVDDQLYSSSISYNIEVAGADTEAPVISITNPSDRSISLYRGDTFNLRGSVSDRSLIKSVNISLNGAGIWSSSNREFVQAINTNNLTEWVHALVVEAFDSNFNKSTAAVRVNILPGNRPGRTPPPAEETSSSQENNEPTPEKSNKAPDVEPLEESQAEEVSAITEGIVEEVIESSEETQNEE